MPMLAMYYYAMGMYTLTISSSSSDSSDSSMTSSSSDEREDEQTSTHKTSNSGNSSLLKFEVHATPHIDVRSFFATSTNNCKLSEYITTASELWTTGSSSPSSICTTTSDFSQDPLPSFSHLLDYFPTSTEQPQPTDAILVPKESCGMQN